ncbi:MAG: hypothetical protein M0Z87_03980 [Actinomycetota bacterium]|nr:hypothetical protein [Actinomycetota bacterium]
MSNLAYLLGAVAFASVVSVIVAFRHRSPTVESNVERFAHGMRALKSRTPERSGAERS